MSSSTNRTAVFNDLFALIYSQPREKQNCVPDFLRFEYLYNNQLLTVFMQNTLSKLVKLLRRHVFAQHPVRNKCAKFKVNRLSLFGGCQMFNTQKPFCSKIPLTMKTVTSNSLEKHCLTKLPSLKFFLKSIHPSR